MSPSRMEPKSLEQRLSRRSFLKSAFAVAAGSSLLAETADAEVRCKENYESQWTGAIIVSSITCESAIAGYLPGGQSQRASQWCWAACISSVLDYHGVRVSQERIVQETYGGLVNLPSFGVGPMLASLNRISADDNGTPFMVRATSRGVNAETAAQELAQDRPLIIGTMGHAMVLTGLIYSGNGMQTIINNASVYDPWPGKGHRNLSGQEWWNMQAAMAIRVQKQDAFYIP